mmetsp:Transcript_138320/g.385811  ORF Transcript_138320/g.385811 Transcript_138320/m.385811 type:complete len:270 (-) Transcript_138320:49-858(-)
MSGRRAAQRPPQGPCPDEAVGLGDGDHPEPAPRRRQRARATDKGLALRGGWALALLQGAATGSLGGAEGAASRARRRVQARAPHPEDGELPAALPGGPSRRPPQPRRVPEPGLRRPRDAPRAAPGRLPHAAPVANAARACVCAARHRGGRPGARDQAHRSRGLRAAPAGLRRLAPVGISCRLAGAAGPRPQRLAPAKGDPRAAAGASAPRARSAWCRARPLRPPRSGGGTSAVGAGGVQRLLAACLKGVHSRVPGGRRCHLLRAVLDFR